MSSEVVSVDIHPEVVTQNTPAVISGLHYEELDSIISDSVLRTFQFAVPILLLGVISVAGIAANVINITVFIRQGALSSSSNVSLLALACVDIMCLLPIFYASVTYAVMRVDSDTIFMTASDFMDVSVIWQHIMAVEINSYITVYISFERCICVVFPLKVKTLFSAKRSLVVMITIIVLFTFSFIPVLSTMRLAEVNDPISNSTKMIFSPTEVFMKVMTVSDYIHATFFRTLSLILVFVCTQITVYYVKLSKSWRKSILTPHAETATSGKSKTKISIKISTATDPSKDEEKRDEKKSNNDNDKKPTTTTTHSHSNKERRLVRMIILISNIFLVCNINDIVIVLQQHSVPFFNELSPMDNFYRILLWSQFSLQSINSSINIFVYYRMSSRYKQEFRVLFGLDKKLT